MYRVKPKETDDDNNNKKNINNNNNNNNNNNHNHNNGKKVCFMDEKSEKCEASFRKHRTTKRVTNYWKEVFPLCLNIGKPKLKAVE